MVNLESAFLFLIVFINVLCISESYPSPILWRQQNGVTDSSEEYSPMETPTGSKDKLMEQPSDMRVTQLVDSPEDAYELMSKLPPKERRQYSAFAAMRGKREFEQESQNLFQGVSKRRFPYGFMAIRGKRQPRSMGSLSGLEYKILLNTLLHATADMMGDADDDEEKTAQEPMGKRQYGFHALRGR